MGPQEPQTPQDTIPTSPVSPSAPQEPQTPPVEQPFAQPQMPAAPMQPVQAPIPQAGMFAQAEMSAPMQPVAPVAKKGLSKGALWGIIGGSIGLILVVVGIVLAIVFLSGPSKADYKTASTAANDAIDAYDKAGDTFGTYFKDIMSGSTSVSTIKDSKSSFETAYSTYKEKIDTLKDLKALRNGDVKKEYDALLAKNKDFVAFIDGFQNSADTLMNMQESCSYERAGSISNYSSTTIASEYDDALGGCIADLETVSKSSNKPLADYASKLLAVYEKQRQLFGNLEDANKSGDVTEQYDARVAISDQVEDFKGLDSYTTITDSLKSLEPKDEIRSFVDLVTKKANQ